MGDMIRVLIPKEDIEHRIVELADEISRGYEGKPLHLISILKGSVFFTCELVRYLTIPVTMDFMAVSSYGNEKTSSGRVKVIKDIDESIEGRDVIVIDDILDSGNTLNFLLKLLQSRNPDSIKSCVLLDKPERREIDVKVDYTGFHIPDRFVVGFGLDYKQEYRNLPYIGIIEGDEDSP